MHATRAAANTSDNPLKLATRAGAGSAFGGAMGDDVSEQLVKLITQEVMAILAKQQGGTSVSSDQIKSDASGATPARAHIAPPIGTCTGDYSKFQELKGKSSATSSGISTTDRKSTRLNSSHSSVSRMPSSA